jgi:PKD repeat protein
MRAGMGHRSLCVVLMAIVGIGLFPNAAMAGEGSLVVGEPSVIQRDAGPADYAQAYFTPAGDPPAYSCTVDYGDGTSPLVGAVAAGRCMGPDHVYAAGTYTVTITVTDSTGASASNSTSVWIPSETPEISRLSVSQVHEARPVSVAATFTDASMATETFSCAVDYGDGSGALAGVVTNGQCSGPEHDYQTMGSVTATMWVADSSGHTGQRSVTITPINDAPIVWIPGLPTLDPVGSVETAVAVFSDPGIGSETYTCSVDYGDGNGPETGQISIGSLDGMGLCIGPSHIYSRGTYTVVVVVTDSNGASSSASGQESLYIGDPIVEAVVVPHSITEGQSASASANFTPSDVDEAQSCAIDYGDGAGWVPGVLSGTTCHGPSHVYAAEGTFTVMVNVFGANSSGYGTATITVHNVAPAVSGYNVPTQLQTGQTSSAVVVFADPGDVSESYSCTIEYGDGIGPQPGVISGHLCAGTPHAYASKGTYTFTALVTDSNGASGDFSTPIIVYNPAPAVEAVVAPSHATIGSPVVASARYVSTGLNPADTCTVDYGDGTGPQAASTDGATCTGPSHVYSKAGTFQITVTVTSTQGASRSSTAAIAVTPLFVVGPVAIPATINEGSSVSASATFSPVGSQTYKCTISYGDGSATVAGTVTGTTCKGPSHKFGRAGVSTVTVSVTGSKGASGSSSATLGVINVGPGSIVGAVAQPILKLGSAASVSVSFTDPGTSESYTVVVTWGDGSQSSTSLGSAARQVSVAHVYARAGRYVVTVGVGDGQGMNVVPAATIPGWPGGFSFVVYDPARTVTGSGTVSSPAAACQLTRACGVASTAGFSVAASYARGATKPTVSFSYSATGFSFTATGADYMVAAGGTVTIHGTGKVNGASGYSFELVMVDGKTDSMQLIVFNSSYTVYQNGNGQPLKTGCVTIK